MILLIANEKANWGSGRWKCQEVRAFLEGQGLRACVSTTQYPGHARELATTAAAQGIDTVVVIGGDGTVNEVITGLLTSDKDHRPGVAIIPAGVAQQISSNENTDLIFYCICTPRFTPDCYEALR